MSNQATELRQIRILAAAIGPNGRSRDSPTMGTARKCTARFQGKLARPHASFAGIDG
jgi:hypothetical protein